MRSELLQSLRNRLGAAYVLTGQETERWSRDWSGHRRWDPLAVVRPANTSELSAILKQAQATGTGVVPVSGNTGLTYATQADGLLMVSLDRLNKILEIRPNARLAVVEAGVVLSQLHDAVDDHGLIFPLTFGARGSAMLGGALSTNAGGSNVVRYGSTRGLCMGLEAVLADGRVLDVMSGVHKDNSGYDLRDLLIGSEGTLGIITKATLRLAPKPLAYVSAMLACPSINAAVCLLNLLQKETSGAVEAFEYMPDNYIDAHLTRFPDARPPFDTRYAVNIFVDIGVTSARDAKVGQDGKMSATADVENLLQDALRKGDLLDATLAQNDAQRSEMWARREAAAELSRLRDPLIDNDIAVPVDKMEELVATVTIQARKLDPGITFLNVAHLGDGNLHFSAWPSTEDSRVHDAIKQSVEDATVALGGSFSAEHGIGLSKLGAMARHKDTVALDTMRAIKSALDPKNILNPGKVLPVKSK